MADSNIETRPGKKKVKRVFAGDIPFELNKEDIEDLFSTVGPIVNIEDKVNQSSKKREYCFIEYPDFETAESAIRNLNNYAIKGRKLKVNYANKDKTEIIVEADEFSDADEFEKENSDKDIFHIIKTLPRNQKFFFLQQFKSLLDNNPDQFGHILENDERFTEILVELQKSFNLDPYYGKDNINHYHKINRRNKPQGKIQHSSKHGMVDNIQNKTFNPPSQSQIQITPQQSFTNQMNPNLISNQNYMSHYQTNNSLTMRQTNDQNHMSLNYDNKMKSINERYTMKKKPNPESPQNGQNAKNSQNSQNSQNQHQNQHQNQNQGQINRMLHNNPNQTPMVHYFPAMSNTLMNTYPNAQNINDHMVNIKPMNTMLQNTQSHTVVQRTSNMMQSGYDNEYQQQFAMKMPVMNNSIGQNPIQMNSSQSINQHMLQSQSLSMPMSMHHPIGGYQGLSGLPNKNAVFNIYTGNNSGNNNANQGGSYQNTYQTNEQNMNYQNPIYSQQNQMQNYQFDNDQIADYDE